MNDRPPPPRPPRSEPEIIPPGAPHGRSQDERIVFMQMQSGRLPFSRPSLFTLLVIAGLVGVMLALLLVLLLGAVLLSLPVVGVIFLALLIGSVLGTRHRLRR